MASPPHLKANGVNLAGMVNQDDAAELRNVADLMDAYTQAQRSNAGPRGVRADVAYVEGWAGRIHAVADRLTMRDDVGSVEDENRDD